VTGAEKNNRSRKCKPSNNSMVSLPICHSI